MILNIFTGGKGGIGKTLNALCCSVHYLRDPKARVNVIDLNYTNTDLFKILYAKGLQENESTDENGFIIKDIGKGIVDSRIICKKNLFAVPHGTTGIWKEIVNAVHSSPNKDILVFDSNFNIASLLYFSNQKEAEEVSALLKQESEIEMIRIWLVWSFNLLTDIGEYDRILQMRGVKSFEEISFGKFQERRDLIHVLNPYKYFRDDEYETVTDLLREIVQRLDHRISVDAHEAITFSQVVEHFTEAIKACKKSQKGALKVLMDRITESYRFLPFNVCFIPFYRKKSVQNYIENLSSNPPQDLEGLIKAIREIYDVVAMSIGKVDDHTTRKNHPIVTNING